jgi:hypothetical protein
MTKSYDEERDTGGGSSGIKFALSKYEYDLYHEEDDVSNPIIRIKRFALPNKSEKWKFYENTKVTLVLEGTKLTAKEKEFIRTVDGINFLLRGYKEGLNSLNAFKKRLKEELKNNS